MIELKHLCYYLPYETNILLDDKTIKLSPYTLGKYLAGEYAENQFRLILRPYKTNNVLSISETEELLSKHWDIFGLIEKGQAVNYNHIKFDE